MVLYFLSCSVRVVTTELCNGAESHDTGGNVAVAKKAPARKAPAKKAVAKKAPVRKAPAKKAPARKR